MKSKLKSDIVKYSFAIFFAVILSIGISFTQNTEARSICYYSYCDTYDSKCKPNENGTNCYGPNGQEPCTSSRPCASDPGEN